MAGKGFSGCCGKEKPRSLGPSVRKSENLASSKSLSEMVWNTEKEETRQEHLWCKSSNIMRLPIVIGILVGTALISIALVLADFLDGTGHTSSRQVNSSDLLNYRHQKLMSSLVDDVRVGPESGAGSGIGGLSSHLNKSDNPHEFNETQRLQRARSTYLAADESMTRLSRSSDDSEGFRSHLQIDLPVAKTTNRQQRVGVPDHYKGGPTSSSGDITYGTGSKTFGIKRKEVINIDKIKGIEALPSEIDELATETRDDQIISDSTMDDRLKNVKCSFNQYDAKIAQNKVSRPILKSDGRFDNPFSSWSQQSMIDIFKFTVLESDESNVPKNKQELDEQLPLMRPDFISDHHEEFKVTWIGHSTLFIQVDGLNILTDPIFSDRASPTQFFGPKRIREPAWKIKNLPRVHIVLISHNHYDHLDADSVKELNDRFGSDCRWIVPLGLGAFMKSMSVLNYIELSWWEKDCFKFGVDDPKINETTKNKTGTGTSNTSLIRDLSAISSTVDGDNDDNHNGELAIYFTPAQHWSRRGINDFNKSLWGSFTIVNRKGSTFLFAGDTGYCNVFKEIGEVFGPFTGAAIPIGAYKPRWFLKTSHVDPTEAVQIHRDLKSMKSISIHHSTFVLSSEYYKEPANMLNSIMKGLNDTLEKPFISLKHGETTSFFNNNQLIQHNSKLVQN